MALEGPVKKLTGQHSWNPLSTMHWKPRHIRLDPLMGTICYWHSKDEAFDGKSPARVFHIRQLLDVDENVPQQMLWIRFRPEKGAELLLTLKFDDPAAFSSWHGLLRRYAPH